MKLRFRLLFTVALCLAGASQAQDTPVYFAPDAGAPRSEVTSNGFVLWNTVVSLSASISGHRVEELEFQALNFHNAAQERILPFTLLLGDGSVLTASDLKMVAPPKVIDLPVQADASRLAERIPGKAVVTEFEDTQGRVHVSWRVILRNGSNYVRQEIVVAAKTADVPVREVRLIDWHMPLARVFGTVKGSPIVEGAIFAAFEDPLSSCAVAGGRARCWIERELPLKAGQTVTYSSVIGVTSAGQLRRGFLHYVERERAHPYRTFLHYNSWYDLGYFSKYDEAGALQVINTFGTELTKKRGVPVNSFLFDDGWDDPATLWQFNSGFPDGFTKLRKAAASYGTAPGVWLSPWGGYGKPKQQRVAAGRAAGYEIVDNGFALSGPKYYAAFRDTCFRFLRDYGVNQFKFDGTGNADRVFPGSEFDSDFAAAIHLIGELRALKPDLYINLTTGTYPSPFWLRYADSIWRGGEDHEFLGVGPKREQWITYRDADTYEHVVLSGPLYPLNSLMLHGMIYAKHARDLDSDPQGDFKNEVRDYFGNGTQLQEMYITPALLSAENWDTLAEAAAWSRANGDVLVDTHWIGGDPALLEVYGWASWSPRKAILVLRNPSDKQQSFDIEIQEAFELPEKAARSYSLHSPWKEDRQQEGLRVTAGTARTFSLKPYEVLVLEGAPVQ
ncbi:MAG TPA: enterotoxin [Candidatus Eisenbacteria bacterium]|nr:enterotoxin [Candidatus Eisenbacteria bacterium]